MKTAALYDVDSRIPNLALMKLSAWQKARGRLGSGLKIAR
jgi:hypothetical protein